MSMYIVPLPNIDPHSPEYGVYDPMTGEIVETARTYWEAQKEIEELEVIYHAQD